MDFKQLCLKRYSLRNYNGREVSPGDLEEILRCAILAPSAVNYQPWHCIIIRSQESIDKIKQCYNRPWFQSVRTSIIVCKDNNKAWVRPSDGKQFGDVDAAIFTDHLCLAATEKGIGTCWICNFNVELFRELFNIPAHLEPIVLVAMGYPAASEQTPKKIRKDIHEIMDIR